ERFDLSANGPRLRFTRDIGTITMDTAGVETVNVKALGGADTTTVNDLTGTDVRTLNIDNGGADAQPDQVIVNGTAASDSVCAGGGRVSGLAPTTTVTGSEPSDSLTVDGLAGDDDFNASASQPLAVHLDGGDGTDSAEVSGSDGDDALAITPDAPAARVSSAGAPGFVAVTAEKLSVLGGARDDTINGPNRPAPLPPPPPAPPPPHHPP